MKPATTEQNQAQRLACWNGLLWAMGDGLVSTTLVVYLALEYGAKGIAISLILAAPKVVGVLRLATPAFLARLQNRKSFCLACFLLSSLVLWQLPFLSAPGFLPPRGSLAVLIGLWSLYHLFEYMAVVALWSWLGDMAPGDRRGQFLGRREKLLTAGGIVGSLASGIFAAAWKFSPHWTGIDAASWETEFGWLAFALPAGAGVGVMLLALLPLLKAPALEGATSPILKDKQPSSSAGSLAAGTTTNVSPAGVRSSLFWLLAYSAWFALVNGVTQSAQSIYPKRVLLFSLFWIIAFTTCMRVGQMALAPAVGRWIDRHGHRGLLIVSQLIVALGPCFYLLATPEQPWWIAGAWLVWIAYVGLNIGLPSLLLKLAPARNRALWIAGYFAVSGLMYGIGTLSGGVLFDRLQDRTFTLAAAGLTLDRFGLLFLAGAVLRASGAVWLLGIKEQPSP
ncbi:MFS transporter [Lignipirellula cremea]|uniref:Major Facilitator Superfamily protein n=1 Tax=Lignipirellula cremea TaxID=2528010 RepID=A0A518DQQ7_9BACT|nr:MFS transporter [Lignipirellula cremea]QDU94152.1 Major Facilitator Superfamily protein [Lignipirellula cremea]